MITVEQNYSLYILTNKKPFDRYTPKDSVKLACFDLDWTLTYNEKKLFPNDPDDIFLMPNRRDILAKYSKTHLLVVFTNQYVRSKKVALERVERVKTFIRKLDLPIICFIATDKDEYRKPEIGMYEQLQKILDNHKLNIKTAFFCGDALGRPQDFDDSDKKFGENAGMEIFTPEEIFPETAINKSCFIGKIILIFVGMAGAGKTSYYKKHFNDYYHINQDELGTFPRVLKEIKASMENGENIVVDSTNPKLETRFEYYKFAEKYGYTPIVIYFARNGVGWNNLRDKKYQQLFITNTLRISFHLLVKNITGEK